MWNFSHVLYLVKCTRQSHLFLLAHSHTHAHTHMHPELFLTTKFVFHHCYYHKSSNVRHIYHKSRNISPETLYNWVKVVTVWRWSVITENQAKHITKWNLLRKQNQITCCWTIYIFKKCQCFTWNKIRNKTCFLHWKTENKCLSLQKVVKQIHT